jgi:hypothetical protein
MAGVDHTSQFVASRHVARVASLLNRAEHHLSAARSATPYRYHKKQIHRLTRDLRSIGAPLARISSALESACNR